MILLTMQSNNPGEQAIQARLEIQSRILNLSPYRFWYDCETPLCRGKAIESFEQPSFIG
jgi:hypothetical protein